MSKVYQKNKKNVDISKWWVVPSDGKADMNVEYGYYGAALNFFLEIYKAFGEEVIIDINREVLENRIDTTDKILEIMDRHTNKQAQKIFNKYCTGK